jgi:hypothetical protein
LMNLLLLARASADDSRRIRPHRRSTLLSTEGSGTLILLGSRSD